MSFFLRLGEAHISAVASTIAIAVLVDEELLLADVLLMRATTPGDASIILQGCAKHSFATVVSKIAWSTSGNLSK